MTVASPQVPRLTSRVVNGLLAIKPLANFAKFQARKMMIERAESIGVPWTQTATALMNRGLEVWEAERQAIQDPALEYPDYYVTSFHAYEAGNLNWEAATEVEVASYAAHARIWPESGAKGDARLRQSYHDLLLEKVQPTPKDILDMGCGAGLSTFALQATYPEAQLTGLDLSPYFWRSPIITPPRIPQFNGSIELPNRLTCPTRVLISSRSVWSVMNFLAPPPKKSLLKPDAYCGPKVT